MATTSPPPHRTLPGASRQPREGLTRYAHGDAALMRRSYQAKDWQPTGCVRVHRGWVGWDVVQQTAMRPHAASSNSVHERALSSSELCHTVEERAEKDRGLPSETRNETGRPAGRLVGLGPTPWEALGTASAALGHAAHRGLSAGPPPGHSGPRESGDTASPARPASGAPPPPR
jgi:hypothetical protein